MRKFLFTLSLCLIAIIAGVTNLFILNEPSPVLAWGGISVTAISGGIVGHHKIRENKQKAAADRERERVEAVRLEESLELWSGKDWAAQRTIDRINEDLGLEDPDDDFFDPECAIVAGGVYADDIQPPADEITGDAIEVRSGDGQLIANFIDTCKDCGDHHDEWMPCLSHALNVIHEFVDNKESDERLSQEPDDDEGEPDSWDRPDFTHPYWYGWRNQ